MDVTQKLLTVTIVLVSVVLFSAALASRRSFLEFLDSENCQIPVLFGSLKRSESPNDYLMTPRRYNSLVPDLVSPVFDASRIELRKAFLAMIDELPRTRLLPDSSIDQLEIEQRTRLFKFPDLVTVRFISLPGDRSTLAIYSRSVYGHYDFGVNKKRVHNLMKLIRQHLPTTTVKQLSG